MTDQPTDIPPEEAPSQRILPTDSEMIAAALRDTNQEAAAFVAKIERWIDFTWELAKRASLLAALYVAYKLTGSRSVGVIASVLAMSLSVWLGLRTMPFAMASSESKKPLTMREVRRRWVVGMIFGILVCAVFWIGMLTVAGGLAGQVLTGAVPPFELLIEPEANKNK